MLIRIIIYCETYKAYSKVRIVFINIDLYLKQITVAIVRRINSTRKLLFPLWSLAGLKHIKEFVFILIFLVLAKTSYP